MEGVRGSTDAARRVEQSLRAIAGVREVAVDAGTGRVMVRWEPPRAREETAVAVRAPRAVARADHAPLTRAVGWLARTVLVVGVEVLLQRVLGPLFPVRRC